MSKWYKILRDLSVNKLRSFFVILAIAIGVFGISVVANSYVILKREMNQNYMDTNPASATIVTSHLNSSEIADISALDYIDVVEEREKVVGRVQIGDNEWKDIWLFVVDDFNKLKLDTFTQEEGARVPNSGEILFERKAITFTGAELGQTINIKIPGGAVTPLKLTGSVHAPGLAPSWMEGFAYGFITRDTYHLLDGQDSQTELRIKVNGDTLDKAHIKELTYRLTDYLEMKGIDVLHIEIPKPGLHPHATQMSALLFLMEIFGILALILSSVLVANMIMAILQEQTRQIGMMKAVGATTLQIAGLYQSIVILFSLTAMLFAIPLGIYAGRGYASIAAQILNFNIYSNRIPLFIFLLELAAGILLPLLVSLFPILRCSQITVLDALSDYGIDQKQYSGRIAERTPGILSRFSRPFLLSLRNTFRKKGRLLFALLVMAVGGTGFIVAMNIYASMYHTVDEKMDAFAYDIQISLEQPQSSADIINTLQGIPGIKEAEAWGGAIASRVYEDKTTGNSFGIIAPPSDTKLLEAPPIYSGHWLSKQASNEIVINQRLLSEEPDLRVGKQIVLRINGVDTTWTVIGISKELLGQPTAYVNMEYLSMLSGLSGRASNAVVVTDQQDVLAQTAIAKRIEQALSDQGISLRSLLKLADYRTALVNHLVVIASFLIAMSVLVILVGGLGLSTTISINTMERTREIGIMRAIGAPAYYITGMIVLEGIIIGVLSWFISTLLSWPLSRYVSNKFGMIFFEAPLEFTVSLKGYLIWLVIVIVFAAAASFYPSYKAARMEIKNALSYE